MKIKNIFIPYQDNIPGIFYYPLNYTPEIDGIDYSSNFESPENEEEAEYKYRFSEIELTESDRIKEAEEELLESFLFANQVQDYFYYQKHKFWG